jgi:sirohydrochlorin cobaltochelatase
MEDIEALPDDYAVCIAGHGSRDKDGIKEFLTLSSKFKEREPQRIVECGFLEFAKPTIDEAITKCVQDGINNIVVIPGVLMAAGHAKNDMPSEVIAMSAEKNSKLNTARKDTLLMTVGRGSSDPDANSNVAKVSRMLWEGMGFGWAETSFIGVTQPLLQDALERSMKMGFKRIIIFPYFLFTGILVKRIFSVIDEFQEKFPNIEFLKAPYLNYDELIIDVFMERAREVPFGLQNMNCQMCKYREQVVGFEHEVGAPQAGHHHHVRGIEGHHGLDHDHDHPHSDHKK